ncbi:L,D-transpeptidase [Pseudahrensia aquimaris]|uniref:L,D-transpeptidase n=1 Tax=Pseudahrensia aquimaris TaxID=744461 RepID=A0ABW3FFB6_9HYPH
MKTIVKAAAFAAAFAMLPFGAHSDAEAGSRVTVGSNLSSPWVLQFKPKKRVATPEALARIRAARQGNRQVRRVSRSTVRATAPRATGSVRRQTALRSSIPTLPDSELMPQIVNYYGEDKPGTIIVNTPERRLYLVMEGGKARRYAIGVGKPGFEWAGVHKVTRKAEWPDWRPPQSMIKRERAKGRELPAFMPGGPENPMGARALYLGSTIYRIHGTNQDWSIGKAVSSGCIRMRNQDVMDLYDRVPRGSKVRVI